MTARPYEDDVEHVRHELARLDVLLRVHLESWWADGGGDELGGLYISDEEVDRLLRLPDDVDRDGGLARGGGQTATGNDLRERLTAISRSIRARKKATESDLRLPELVDRFDLDRVHRDALLLALAPELERKYEKVYAYFQDDVTQTRPTVELLLQLLCETPTERLAAREAFSWRSPLVRSGLVTLTVDGDAPLPSQSVAIDERVVDHLLGADALPADLSAVATAIEPERTVDGVAVDPDTRDTLERMATARDDGSPSLAYFHGPDGSRAHAAVEAVCGDRGVDVIRLDAGAVTRHDLTVSEPGAPRLDLLVREARLRDAAIHLSDVDAVSDADAGSNGDGDPRRADLTDVVAELAAGLGRFHGPVFVTGERSVSPRLGAHVDDRDVTILAFDGPSYERRRELWAGVEGLEPDPEELAAKFQLTAGRIEDAVATARAMGDGAGLSTRAVYAACRAQSRERLGSLATAVDTGYTWDDIVLPSETMAHLREVAAHVKHQGRVFSDWGFEARYTNGRGLTVLFTGPSGTGKTMAAEIVAGEAGLDLYRIDLASVVSKYVGETEENLQAVFDEAAGSNAVLFFDEADALFGSRSEVSDAQDRYANVEVSYLLQRMEAHDGTVILASNLEENIDDAFLRRINVSVEFPMPDREARERIWRIVFPEATPTAELDIDFLAGFDIAGGSIKNAALTAAFLAAEDDESVRMKHVVQALRRELEKSGRLVNPADFGEYQGVLQR